jgi:hypothetical protein
VPKTKLLPVSEQRQKGALQGLLMQRVTMLQKEKEWVEAVNRYLGRSFLIPFAAERQLKTELKYLGLQSDIEESAEDTIERLMKAEDVS